MDPKNIEKFAKILKNQGDKLLESEFKLTLTGELLRSLNDSFSLIIDDENMSTQTKFQVTKPNNSKSNVFRELMLIFDFFQKTLILKLTKFLDDPIDDDDPIIDISKFRNLSSLEIQRISINRVIGIQQLRSQLQEITAERSLDNIKDLIMYCAGDKSQGFIWSSLKYVNFSFNNLEKIDSSFEFTPYIQHLNLSHNKIFQISALVWLPNLKIINLSFNQLVTIPKLNENAFRRLQTFIINDNLIEEVSGLVKLDALLDLDLSGNCLLDHSLLLPLCTLNALRSLNLSLNPLAYHPKHRSATCRYLSKNVSTVKFQLDGRNLSQSEKQQTGCYENYYPVFGHRMTVSTMSSSRATPQTPSTKSISNTPDNNSLSSANGLAIHETQQVSTSLSLQKRIRKVRCVEIEESGNNTLDPKSPPGRKLLKEGSKEHLVTKREIEQLREQFGSDWLNQVQNNNQSVRRKLDLGDLLSASPDLKLNDSFPIDSSTLLEETIAESTETSVYASALDETYNAEIDDELVVSEVEENELQFVVTDKHTNEDLFLIVSEINIREKDPMNGRTLAKWGISTLESVERPKTSIIRLTFDTVRKDKRERQYAIEEDSCQELEKILRDFLSSKPLSAMNFQVFKCPKCNLQFSREIDERKKRNYEIKCPCGNKYVIEIQMTAKAEVGSPKPSFLVGNTFMPLATRSSTTNMSKASSISIEKKSDGSGEAAKISQSFSSIESAFDSNQSVAGSSVEVLSECSSQVSISQASQSSIEVLDTSRKPSEERRISLAPSLDTIEDGLKIDTANEEEAAFDSKKLTELKSKAVLTIGNINLTESSSSGSVCESVVTAYEGKRDKTPDELPKLDGVFKTSSLLLSKTPKPKTESEPLSYSSLPIQYNFENLSVVDHRIKLFLFQNILEENDEKLIWLVKCFVCFDDPTLSCTKPALCLIVMSTKKVYILKIVGNESEEISSWLKKSIICSLERIKVIWEISFKTGFTFVLSESTNIHLLLKDQNLTDTLRNKITSSNQNIEIITSMHNCNKRLHALLNDEDVKTIAFFTSCVTTLCSATDPEKSRKTLKENLDYGVLIVTLHAIYVTSSVRWLCENVNEKAFPKQTILSQPMTNLVELENVSNNSFTLNFMDEIENTIEKWKFDFESYPKIAHCLDVIDNIWREIFCVPLINNDQILGS